MTWTKWLWASLDETTPNRNHCPVPHNNSAGDNCPVNHGSSSMPESSCPVDHDTRTNWLNNIKLSTYTPESIEVKDGSKNSCSSNDETSIASSKVNLPMEREISSIPRTSADSNWVYPSEKQFYEAMKRKNWSPQASDMKTVVPIHNSVNERTWAHILNWERSFATANCGLRLTSFKGNPSKLTPRAWVKTLIGGEKPFDRHDWVVNRCGTEIEYVIDYYSTGDGVFIDARPKLNSLEGIKLRIGRGLGYF